MPVPALRLTSPELFVASIPHVLGHYPQDSIVVVLVDADDYVLLAARVDTPQPDTLASWSEDFASQLSRTGLPAVSAHVVTFASGRAVPAALAAAEALASALQGSGVDVSGEFLVDGEAFRPVPWRSAVSEPSAVSAAVRAEVAEVFGSLPEPSREDVLRRFAPDEACAGDVAAHLVGLNGAVCSSPAEVDALAGEVYDALLAVDSLDAAVASRVLSALAQVRVRDALMYDVVGSLPGDAARCRAALTRLVQVAPAGFRAPVLTVAAAAFFAAGNGMVVSSLLERAVDEDPGYALALLMQEYLARAAHPQEWVDALRGIPRDVILGADEAR